MTIKASCSCGKTFQAKPELAGKTVRCPSCGSPFQVPLAAAPASTPAADPLGQFAPLDPQFAAPNPQFPANSFNTPAASPYTQPTTFGQPHAAAPQSKSSNRGLIIGVVVGGVALGGVMVFVVLVALLLPAVQAARNAARRQAAKNSGTAPGTATAKIPAGKWRTYTSASGKYSVDMPGNPASRMQFAPGGISVSVALLEISRSQACAVKHVRIPAHRRSSIDLEGGFVGGRDGELRSLNATLISEKKIKLRDVPGRELRLRGAVGSIKVVKTLRMYITSDMIYTIEWISAEGQEPAADIKRFFDSFKPTNPKPPTVAKNNAGSNASDNAISGSNSGVKLELTEQRRKQIYKAITGVEAGFAASEKQAQDVEAKGQTDLAARLRQQTEKTRRTHRENMKRIWKLTQAEFDQILAEGKQKGW